MKPLITIANYYEQRIMACTGCTFNEVAQVEDIMRNDILHSTLDWLSPEQFKQAAIEAYELYKIIADLSPRELRENFPLTFKNMKP